jgi:hypothetical protein
MPQHLSDGAHDCPVAGLRDSASFSAIAMSSSEFFGNPQQWSESFRQLPPNELGPSKIQQSGLASLETVRLHVAEHWPRRDNRELGDALVAVWALHQDCLDAAHEISQEMKSDLGSYIHGIVHRREPDYSNARYWFRQVGELPFFGDLQRAAGDELGSFATDPRVAGVLSSKTWRPIAFVDLCEFAIRGPKDLHFACRKVQQHELALLFDYCIAQVGT